MNRSRVMIADFLMPPLLTVIVFILPCAAQETSATKAPAPNSPVDEEELNRRKEDFGRRDRDGDDKLTLEEQIEDRQGPQRIAARDLFFRADLNEDGALTLDEFVNRQRNRPMSTSATFRQMDLDEDGLLIEDEVIRLKKNFEESARLNFHKFDVNRDNRMNVREFAMMPAQKPTPETMFAGLDTDSSGSLTRDEFLAIHNENSLRRAHREFFQRNVNEDNQLSRSEYLAPLGELPTQPRRRFEFVDLDGNGSISLVELCNRPPPRTSDEFEEQQYEVALMKAEDRIALADSNGDGQLSREEWDSAGPIAMNDDNEAIEPAGSASTEELSSVPAAPEWDPFVIAVVVADVALVAAVVGWWFTHKRPSPRTPNSAIVVAREQSSSGS